MVFSSLSFLPPSESRPAAPTTCRRGRRQGTAVMSSWQRVPDAWRTETAWSRWKPALRTLHEARPLSLPPPPPLLEPGQHRAEPRDSGETRKEPSPGARATVTRQQTGGKQLCLALGQKVFEFLQRAWQRQNGASPLRHGTEVVERTRTERGADYRESDTWALCREVPPHGIT